MDAEEVMVIVLLVLIIGGMFGARGCITDHNRMQLVAACLEQGREAAECEVIK